MAIYLRGVSGTGGIALGRAVRYTSNEPTWAAMASDPDTAMIRFTTAQMVASGQLRMLADQLRVEGCKDEAEILDAHSLLVEDELLTSEVNRRVREHREPVETAIMSTITMMRTMLKAIDDPYLSTRALDMDAIGRALLTALHGEPRRFSRLSAGSILIANDLTPAEVVVLRDQRIAGFATAEGGPNSHTSILARAFAIPAIVGLGAATLAVPDGANLIVDTDAALLIVNPDTAERVGYERRMAVLASEQLRADVLRDVPATMADGHRVVMWANISNPAEAAQALEHGAEGIGLFRTEFLFLDRPRPPDEEEQFIAYRRVLEAMPDRVVIARTIDLGAEKRPLYLDTGHEPLLGERGVRLCMRHPELLRVQLRALLRAAVWGRLWIMLPMVALPEDLAWGREQVRLAADALAAEGVRHLADVPVGVMIETPAAAMTADLLARDASFFSIGSNDLTQYTLAIDRETPTGLHMSAAVMRLIAQAAVAARRHQIPISICGELAADPEVAGLLVGLGLDELSMTPTAIPVVKQHLRHLTLLQARAAARRVLG